MSLILDALRKSEAERRRGTSPDLFASLPTPVASRRPELLRLWPWFALAVLVLGGASIFWLSQNASAPAVVAPAQGEVADDSRAEIASTAQPSAPAAAPPGATIVPVQTLAPTLAPTKPVAGPQPSQSNGIASTPSPTPPSATTSAAASSPAPAADNSLESLPPIAVLSFSERASLPPLKLSMHVWDSEPGKRFAIIDGQRVGEGAMVGSAVVEEIRRDGVVLEIGGRRILLPRP